MSADDTVSLQWLAVLKCLAFSIHCGHFSIGISARHFTYTNPTIFPTDDFSQCKDSWISPLKLNKRRFLEFGRSLVICVDSLSLLFTLSPYYSLLVYQHFLFAYEDYSLTIFAAVSVENVLFKKKKTRWRQGEYHLVALSDRACCHGVLDQIGWPRANEQLEHKNSII